MKTLPVPRRWRSLLAAPVLALIVPLLGGCQVHYHRIGGGATGIGSESDRQYYALFGLLQLNDVNVQRMADELTSYDIESGFTGTDFLMTALLLPLTVTTRTVTVYR